MNLNIGRELMLMEKNFMTVEEVANHQVPQYAAHCAQRHGHQYIHIHPELYNHISRHDYHVHKVQELS